MIDFLANNIHPIPYFVKLISIDIGLPVHVSLHAHHTRVNRYYHTLLHSLPSIPWNLSWWNSNHRSPLPVLALPKMFSPDSFQTRHSIPSHNCFFRLKQELQRETPEFLTEKRKNLLPNPFLFKKTSLPSLTAFSKSTVSTGNTVRTSSLSNYLVNLLPSSLLKSHKKIGKSSNHSSLVIS